MYAPTSSAAADAADLATPTLPRSPTSLAINLAGVGALAAAVAGLRAFGREMSDLAATLCAVGAFAGTVVALEAAFLRTWRRPSTGLDFARPERIRYGPVLAKLGGFHATLLAGLGLYALFPEYRGAFYEPFFRMLHVVLPAVAAAAVPYFLLLARYDRRPRDGYWQVALLLGGRLRAIDGRILSQHLLGWLVKAFFTPLMFVYCHDAVQRLRWFDPASVLAGFPSFFEFTYQTLFDLDVALALTGYLLTVRLLDSHLRSTEPTLLGWAVALACYQPFWSFLEGGYLPYGAGGTTWGHWFSGMRAPYIAWGCAILALTAVYVWATLPFGIRFSNLTHRGILTNGPYRFTKHPAYVSKNLSWWLISMPFLSTSGWRDAVRHSLMLLGVNLLYLLRARTEERHLSGDPAYVAYATAMERRSVFRWVGRLLPALRFRPGRLFHEGAPDAPRASRS